jgi:hypothetical protein
MSAPKQVATHDRGAPRHGRLALIAALFALTLAGTAWMLFAAVVGPHERAHDAGSLRYLAPPEG